MQFFINHKLSKKILIHLKTKVIFLCREWEEIIQKLTHTEELIVDLGYIGSFNILISSKDLGESFFDE